MPVQTDIDIRSAVNALRREFMDLDSRQVTKATARALNETIVKAKTAASREIRKSYKVKSAVIKSGIKPGKSTQKRLIATLSVSVRPMPVFLFNPRQLASGVSVDVTGSRKVIRGAFIATMRNGHKGVFARGGYHGKDFTFRKKRIVKQGPDLPIEELVTASPFSMITNRLVNKHLSDKIENEFPNILLKQLLTVRRGF